MVAARYQARLMSIEVAVNVRGRFACRCGCCPPFPCAQIPSDGVMHALPGRGGQVRDVVDPSMGGASAVQGDQQVAAIPGRDLGDGCSSTSMWSLTVLEPALPVGSSSANDSPVLSHQAING